MSSADPIKKLHALVKRLRAKHAEPEFSRTPEWEGVEPTLCEMVYSILLNDSTVEAATGAFGRVSLEFVDANELRIALPDEIATLLDEPTAAAQERAARLKACLHDIYQREHAMTLAMLVDAGKRECRLYLESLNGVTPFVVSRLKLVSLGGTPIPVDERLLARLHSEGSLEAKATCEDACDWLPKQFEPPQSASIHGLFQAWMEDWTAAPATVKTERGKAPKKDPAKPAARKAKKSKAT